MARYTDKETTYSTIQVLTMDRKRLNKISIDKNKPIWQIVRGMLNEKDNSNSTTVSK